MQTLDITLANNDTKVFDIGGAYFEFIEGVGSMNVNFYDANGSRAKDLEMLGALPGYWVSGSFIRFELTNTAGFAQAVRVMYGSGMGGSRRIQGNVRVVDQSADKTNAGTQYMVHLSNASAAGGWIQTLKTTSKKAFIKRLILSSDTTGTLCYGSATGVPTSNPNVPNTVKNKRLSLGGGADTTVAAGTCAAVTPTGAELPGVSPIGYLAVNAGVLYEIPLTSPIEIDPGTLFFVNSAAANRSAVLIADIEESL